MVNTRLYNTNIIKGNSGWTAVKRTYGVALETYRQWMIEVLHQCSLLHDKCVMTTNNFSLCFADKVYNPKSSRTKKLGRNMDMLDQVRIF